MLGPSVRGGGLEGARLGLGACSTELSVRKVTRAELMQRSGGVGRTMVGGPEAGHGPEGCIEERLRPRKIPGLGPGRGEWRRRPLSSSDEEAPSSKEATAEATSSEEEQEPGFPPLSGSFGPGSPCGTSPMDGRALRRSSRGSFTRGSLEDLLSVEPEAYQSSVWLGTEDGW